MSTGGYIYESLADAYDKLRTLRAFAAQDTLAGFKARACLVQAASLFRRLDHLIDTETDRLYAPLREDRLHALERRQMQTGGAALSGQDDAELSRVDFSHLPQDKRNDLEDAAQFLGAPDTADTERDAAAGYWAGLKRRQRAA